MARAHGHDGLLVGSSLVDKFLDLLHIGGLEDCQWLAQEGTCPGTVDHLSGEERAERLRYRHWIGKYGELGLI